MYVYIIVHETYGYEGDEFDAYVEVFENFDNAKTYFELMKSNIIDEYVEHAGVGSIEELLTNDDSFYMDEEETLGGDPYFFIDYDEYGHDKVRIYKKPVMSFNIEEV